MSQPHGTRRVQLLSKRMKTNRDRHQMDRQPTNGEHRRKSLPQGLPISQSKRGFEDMRRQGILIFTNGEVAMDQRIPSSLDLRLSSTKHMYDKLLLRDELHLSMYQSYVLKQHQKNTTHASRERVKYTTSNFDCQSRRQCSSVRHSIMHKLC